MEWRDVPGYEGFYQVSGTGDVARVLVGGGRREIAQQLSPKGYLQVHLSAAGEKRHRNVHQVVAMAFLPTADGQLVRHLNDDKTDNRAVNLAWGSYSDNAFDAVANGTHANAAKTECLRGHAFDLENTGVQINKTTGRSGRYCKTCARAAAKRRYMAAREIERKQQ